MAFPTNPIYKKCNCPITGNFINIKMANGGVVPLDEANTDYQEYLAWVAEGNTAEAAD